MQNFSDSIHDLDEKLVIPVIGIHLKLWIVTLCFGIIGFMTPMIFGFITGFPVPHAQDELSYTVAADTYSIGRITNPTPAYFESFETPHVLMEPSYISKYPPMQGIFMAIGKNLFGHIIFGIWLSCGLMAASLFWMLAGWTKPNWAFLGTVLMILFLGFNSYWAQTYWGGMISAAGGAIFLGGFRRIFTKLSFGSAALMAVGGVILINSRPFEGTLTMLPPLFVLLVWLLRDNTNTVSAKFSKVIAPGLIVAVISLSAMFYQFYRVTGNPLVMPYSVHHAQYYPTPLFIFQPVNHSATKGNARIRKVYEHYTSPQILENVFKNDLLPDSIYLNSFYGFIYLIVATPFFLLSPLLTILVYFSLPLLIKRDKWMLLITGTILFTFACMCIGIWWDQYHYIAPLTSCFFLLSVESMRQFYDAAKNIKEKYLISGVFVAVSVGSFVFLQICSYTPPKLESDFSADRARLKESLESNQEILIKKPSRATFFKSEFENIIDNLPDKYIAVVKYDEKFDFNDEIIYNKADIENAKLIWAHDLGNERNEAMLKYYNHRKILQIFISDAGIEIKPAPLSEFAD